MAFHGNKFTEIRKTKHISIKFLTSQLGVSQRTLWGWENGEREPDEKYIRKLAKLADVPLTIISDLQPEQNLSCVSLSSLEDLSSLMLSDVKPYNTMLGSLIDQIQEYRDRTELNSLVIKALMHSLDAIFYVKNTQNHYMAVSTSFLKYLELPPDTFVVNKPDSYFYNHHEAERILKEDEYILTTGKPVINREDFIPGTRKQKWGLCTKVLLLDSNQKTIGLIGTYIDITERKNAEKIREISGQVTDSLSLVLIITELATGRILHVNKNAESVYGYSVDRFMNDPEIFFDVVHPDDKKTVNGYRKKNNFPDKMIYRIITPDKQTKCIRTVVTKASFNGRECMVFVNHDISGLVSSN